MDQVMKANRTGFLLFSNTQISSSLKLEKLIWFLKLQVLYTSHTLSKPLQLHTACKMSSFSSLHLSHLCSVIIVQRKRLHFEGNELRHALQIRFLTLLGHSRAQIFFQSSFSWSWFSATRKPTSSSKIYSPFCNYISHLAPKANIACPPFLF